MSECDYNKAEQWCEVHDRRITDCSPMADRPTPDDGHRWEGDVINFQFTGCIHCGAPVASHKANQTLDQMPTRRGGER